MKRLLLCILFALSLAMVAGVTVKRGPGGGATTNLDFAADTDCHGLWIYAASDVEPGTAASTVTSAQDTCLVGGSLDLTNVLNTPVISASVPGTWGAGGTDPRVSVDFDRTTTEALWVVDSTDEFSPASGMTICLWANRASVATNQRVAEKTCNEIGNNACNALHFLTGATEVTRGQFGFVAQDGLTDVSELSVWHHHCVTVDATTDAVTVYDDGVNSCGGGDCGTGASPDTAAFGSGFVQLGGGGASHNVSAYDGLLHEVLIVLRELNAHEIAAVYRCGARDQIQDRGGPAMAPGLDCAYNP